jgi:hypothetical protein
MGIDVDAIDAQAAISAQRANGSSQEVRNQNQ